jgi:hypothetical protein
MIAPTPGHSHRPQRNFLQLAPHTLTSYEQLAEEHGIGFRLVRYTSEEAMQALATWCGGRYEWTKGVIVLPNGDTAGDGDTIVREGTDYIWTPRPELQEDILDELPADTYVFEDVLLENDPGDWIVVAPNGQIMEFEMDPEGVDQQLWQFLLGYTFRIEGTR